MAKVKFDVSNSDPEKAVGQDFTQAPPGVYVARLKEINPGFSKGDNGQPDKKRPRLEVIVQPLKDRKTGKKETWGQIWDYVSFSPKAEWKLDNFLQACGLASKKKRKGQFDTEELEGKMVLIRVKADKDLNGDYRAKIGTYLPFEEDEDEVDTDDDAVEASADSDDDNGTDEDEDEESPF